MPDQGRDTYLLMPQKAGARGHGTPEDISTFQHSTFNPCLTRTTQPKQLRYVNSNHIYPFFIISTIVTLWSDKKPGCRFVHWKLKLSQCAYYLRMPTFFVPLFLRFVKPIHLFLWYILSLGILLKLAEYGMGNRIVCGQFAIRMYGGRPTIAFELASIKK